VESGVHSGLMPAWAKVLLVVIVVGILVSGVALFFGIRWARREFGQLRKEGPSLVADAQDFGRGKDGEACVVEALARLSRCDGFPCEVRTKVFLNSSLSTANVTEDFCKGVPKPTEIFATATWAQSECARRGLPGSQRCTRLITGIQERCYR
jgi:hypothetical protein